MDPVLSPYKNFVEFFVFVLSGGELAASLADGFNGNEGPPLLETMTRATPAFQDFSLVGPEGKALAADDKARPALIAYAKADFDIPQDALEEDIETVIEAVVGFSVILKLFEAKKLAKAAA